MNTEDQKKYLSFKLLEWAGCCYDWPSYNNLSDVQKDNALTEAGYILTRLKED